MLASVRAYKYLRVCIYIRELVYVFPRAYLYMHIYVNDGAFIITFKFKYKCVRTFTFVYVFTYSDIKCICEYTLVWKYASICRPKTDPSLMVTITCVNIR